jgi:hypothetical protein
MRDGYKNLWRGGLPPFGCAAVVKPHASVHMSDRDRQRGVASQPNGGKPPRHGGLMC